MANREKPLLCKPLALDEILWGNAMPGYTADHLARHDAVGLVWKTDGASSVWASGQFEAGSSSVDFVALLMTNAVSGTTARLRLGNSFDDAASGVVYDSTALSIRATAPVIEREDGLSHWFFELPSAQTASHWRIDIGSHTGDFEASSLILGKKVVPSRFYSEGYEFGAIDLGKLDINRWGVLDDSGGIVQRTLDFTLGWQTEAEFEASFRPLLERIGQRGLLYCCFDPANTAYRDARTYFGVLGKPMTARGIRKPKTYTQEFSIRSLI